MVMKRLEGVTLRVLIDEPDHARWIELGGDRLGFYVLVIRRLCDALALAASRGVVHRDIKPENVMIGRFGEVYLLDWGIAIAAGQALPNDAIAGTPIYMAPEMLRPASGEIDARTDVYLLGATLHECVTGAPPHRGTTLLTVLASVAESAPIAYDDDVPAALATLLRRAMHREPRERFADARELGRALDAFVAHRAAEALVVAADAQRASLEAAIDRAALATEVHSLFHACRFGYEHALRDWPEADAAKLGRERAIERMARYALDAGDRVTGQSLLAALASPPADLALKLAALDRDARAVDAERARLRALERDNDLSVGARERTIAVRVVGIVAVFGMSVFGGLLAMGGAPTARTIAVFTIVPLLLIAFALVRWRDRLLANRVSKQLAFSLLTVVSLVMLHRIVGVAREMPLSDIASGDAYIVAAAAMLSALTLRRLYFIPAFLFAAAGSMAPFMGTTAFAPMGVAAVISIALLWISPRALAEPALGSVSGAVSASRANE